MISEFVNVFGQGMCGDLCCGFINGEKSEKNWANREKSCNQSTVSN